MYANWRGESLVVSLPGLSGSEDRFNEAVPGRGDVCILFKLLLPEELLLWSRELVDHALVGCIIQCPLNS